LIWLGYVLAGAPRPDQDLQVLARFVPQQGQAAADRRAERDAVGDQRCRLYRAAAQQPQRHLEVLVPDV